MHVLAQLWSSAPPSGDVVLALASVLDRLQEASGAVGYLLIVLSILAGGVGVPVPEEAVLVVTGWMAATGRLDAGVAWFTCWAAIVAWDVVVHSVGRAVGPRLARSRIGRRIGERRIEGARRFFDRHGVVAVAAARFVMGTRNATFLVAGAAGMPLPRFVAVIAPLGVVSTGVAFWMGYHFGEDLQGVLERTKYAEWVFLGLIVVAVLLLWLRERRRHARGS